MNKHSLIKNFIYQNLYQILILILPFLLMPYLTRTLKETALGTYIYINSIVGYFVMLANLGISIYGRRLISSNIHNSLQLRKSFWSLFCLHVIISIFFVFMYILCVCIFINKDAHIYFIQSIFILSALVDITWLFYGMENFSSVVIRNSIVKAVQFIAVFSFVKGPGDLWKYALICGLGEFIGNAIMLPMVMKIIQPIKVSLLELKQHIKPLLVFAVALIGSAVYTSFNKTLLGIMSTRENVAFFEYSYKIISIPLSFVTILGTVMLPRACRLVVENKINEQKRLLEYSFLFSAFIGVGTIFFLLALSENLIIAYYGKSFEICGSITVLLSPLVYVIGTGSILRTQCLIPNHMDKQFNLCIIYNAIISIILCIILIPKMGLYGAIIATICAELFGMFYQMYLCRNFIEYRLLFKQLLPFILIGIIMFITIKISQVYTANTNEGLLFNVVIGGAVYCLVSILYIYFFRKDLVDIFRKKQNTIK